MHERLSKAEAEILLTKLRGWKLVKGRLLRQELVMKDFAAAAAFISAAAKVADSLGHHPDLHLTGFRHLTVEATTHDLGGLSIDDFRLALKLDELPRKLKTPSRRR